MIPWILLDSAQVPGGSGMLGLYQRGDELSIRIVGEGGLMNSRIHDSEDALAELSCRKLANCTSPRILIGGLGMGFTLAAALRNVGPQAKIEVAELVPAVVRWNRGVIGKLAGHPLQDARVIVREVDVAVLIKARQQAYDAILLDVDNGPDGLTRSSNDCLYSLNGLNAAYAALRNGGVLAVWSVGPDQDFTQKLQKMGFAVEQVHVRARGLKGERHVIWIASRG
jgi:spermidine synthase